MFTVQGLRGDDLHIPYTVVIDGIVDDITKVSGCVTDGSPAIGAELEANDGQTFRIPPVGPDLTLDIEDPWLVLQWLYTFTNVTEVTGDEPTPPEENPLDVPADAVV